MIVCIDMVILAFLFRSPQLQTFVVTGWTGVQVLFGFIASPYNKFQKNVNLIIVAVAKQMIFMLAMLNGLVGRESKDVAGPFSDLCGPLMIFMMLVMIGANMLLQFQPMITVSCLKLKSDSF